MIKKQVAVGILTTEEVMEFFKNVSMLDVGSNNKLDIKASDHKVPDNTWSVSLWTNDENRDVLIDSLISGSLAHNWCEKFVINEKFDENNLPPIPEGYEVVDEYEYLEQTDMFLHDGMWISATDTSIEISAIMTEKSVYHGNVPVIRKKPEKGE